MPETRMVPAASAQSFHVQPQEAGMRLDHYLVRLLPEQSRSSLDRQIRSGFILVNNQSVKPAACCRA
ncbi:hypothetical protein VU05_02695 [Desulfobulbus sp. F1]|nr:hypothetical protein [Desulfobulbus sp. F1]